MANISTQNSISDDSSAITLITTLSTINHTEGGYDYELLGVQDSRYECPICLLCFRDPVLTTCGHKFCSKCIGHWVINHGGKCPVDSVSLSAENIFPDNYTRREIMQSKAKCPYTKEGCDIALPINDLERHIQTEHLSITSSLSISPGKLNGSVYTSSGVVMECSYKDVGCDVRVPHSELQRHYESDVHHHLQLLTTAYKRLKIFSSRSNLEYPPGSHDAFWRQDSRDSARWLLEETPESDDYQFRRQRSWDSVRFARKHNIRPRFQESRLAESDESLCKSHQNNAGENGHGQSTGCGSIGGTEPHVKDIFERLVRLEQTDREKQIKIDILESRLTSAVNLFSTATSIIKDLTARYCHGVFVWKIPEFKKLCDDMRKNPNRVLNSPGFYTDTFGYKLCLRFNLTTPSSLGASAVQPVDVPLDQDEDTFVSLYIHFMQGEFDDTLLWPFNGELKLILIHPITPEDSITETMFSKPEAAAFAKPTLPRNPKGFGYPEFCPISKIFASGFVMNDTLVCKVLAKAY